MTLPAHLQRFLTPETLTGRGLLQETAPLSLGNPELDRALPDGGLLRGSVIELAVSGAALGTSLSLSACRSAQQEGVVRNGEPSWCAFVDPTASLHAPGVAQAGVELGRLLVVRPAAEALSRVTIRLAESQAFSVLVVDTRGVPGASLSTALGAWTRVVRRMALALSGSSCIAMLITDRGERRPLPLPVSLRLELRRSSEHRLELQVGKDKRGRVSPPRSIAWVRSKPVALAAVPALREHAG